MKKIKKSCLFIKTNMNHALSKAIYYSDTESGSINQVLKNNVCEYTYSNKNDFMKVIENLKKDINIRNIFGTTDSICYKICDSISSSYDALLLDKIDSLLIITRKDNSTKFVRSNGNKYGIIKIDSVLAELSTYSEKESNYSYLIIIPIIFLTWKFKDSFSKSDLFLSFFKS